MFTHMGWDELGWNPVMEGIRRKVIHGAGMTIVLVELGPGVNAAVHTHHHEQFTHVISGSGEFNVDGKPVRVKQGDLLYFPSELPHGVVVDPDEPLVVFDIFTPQRDEFAASTKA